MSKLTDRVGITAGPWEVDKNERRNLMVYCDDVTGSRIADCTNNNVFHPVEVKKANARLIAAAPDMLEWLVRDLLVQEAMDDVVTIPANDKIRSKFGDEVADHLATMKAEQIAIIEKATGLTWEQIREVME